MPAQTVQRSSRLLRRRSVMRKVPVHTKASGLLAGQRASIHQIQQQPPQVRPVSRLTGPPGARSCALTVLQLLLCSAPPAVFA